MPRERLERVERVRRHQRENDALSGRDQGTVAEEIRVRGRSGDDRQKLLQDAVLLGERERVSGSRLELVETQDELDPVVLRRKRHFDFGYDAVRPIGVNGLVQVLAL